MKLVVINKSITTWFYPDTERIPIGIRSVGIPCAHHLDDLDDRGDLDDLDDRGDKW